MHVFQIFENLMQRSLQKIGYILVLSIKNELSKKMFESIYLKKEKKNRNTQLYLT